MPSRKPRPPPVRRTQQSLAAAGLEIARYPELTKPDDDVGKTISVPDVYWAVTTPEGTWPCTIMEFDPAHKFTARSTTLVPAFKLFEISNEETFWMMYPLPYLEYRSSDQTKLLCPELFPQGDPPPLSYAPSYV